MLCLKGTHLDRYSSDGNPGMTDGRDPVPPRTQLLSGKHIAFAKMAGGLVGGCSKGLS